MIKFAILALTALSSAIAVNPAPNEATTIGPSSAVAANRQPLASSSVALSGNTPVQASGKATATPSSSGGLNYPPDCVKQLATQKVEFTKPVGNNGIRLDNVPAACMPLARYMMRDDTPVDDPVPQTIDGDSIIYDNLSAADYAYLSSMFDRWAASQAGLMKRNLESEGGM